MINPELLVQIPDKAFIDNKGVMYFHNLNELRYQAEEAECVNIMLDSAGVPTVGAEGKLSLWGRVMAYKEMGGNNEQA
jgi:hypothetical protein